MENDFRPTPPSPLGEPPAFILEARRRQEVAARATTLPFRDLESDPYLRSCFADLAEFATRFQIEFGLDPISIQADSIHPLTRDNMELALQLLDADGDNGGGIYDPVNDIMYVREPDDPTDLSQSIWFIYAIAHELGHKLSRGLFYEDSSGDKSDSLTEGVADRFARDFMQKVFLQKYQPEVKLRIAQQFSEYGGIESPPDITVRQDDIICIDRDKVTGLSRMTEIRVVEKLEEVLGRSKFIEFMQRAATSHDIAIIRNLIGSQLGNESWVILTHKSPQEILNWLEGLK